MSPDLPTAATIALLALKDVINWPRSPECNLTSWTGSVCSGSAWKGVTCTAGTTGDVESVIVWDCVFRGVLPTSLTVLTSMKYLSITGTQDSGITGSGTLPAAFSQLT